MKRSRFFKVERRSIRDRDERWSKRYQQAKLDPVYPHQLDEDGLFEDKLVTKAGGQPASSMKLNKHRAYATNAFDRWLEKQIGRPWDKVRSEALERLNHLHYVLSWKVIEHIEVCADGTVREKVGRTWYYRELTTGEIYVDTKGIVRMAPRVSRKYQWKLKKFFFVDGEYVYLLMGEDKLAFRAPVSSVHIDHWCTSSEYLSHIAPTIDVYGNIHIPSNSLLPEMVVGKPIKARYTIERKMIKSVNSKDIARLKDRLDTLTPFIRPVVS